MQNGKPLSVTQLNGYVKGVFEDELVLHNIAVYGEIYEFSISGQNTFITLRDGDCSLSCVRYGVTERYALGTKVLLRGTVTFYPRGGRVSFVFRTIEPYGQSVQYAAFLKLKEKLRAAGWFENRPPLKPFIKDVVIVTSSTGAVIHDFIRVVSQPFVNIRLFPVKVQGDGAAQEIAAAIDAVNAHTQADVIVVARGGGANVDLEPFNTEVVATAVHHSAIPILSAVGHETDFTLCDFCASARAATPSVAGEMIVSANARLLDKIAAYSTRATRGITNLYHAKAQRLYRASVQGMSASERSAALCRQRLEYGCERIETALRRQLAACTARMMTTAANVTQQVETVFDRGERRFRETTVRLQARNPLKLLSDGYARVQKDGRDVKAAAELKSGDGVTLHFADGAVGAKVR